MSSSKWFMSLSTLFRAFLLAYMRFLMTQTIRMIIITIKRTPIEETMGMMNFVVPSIEFMNMDSSEVAGEISCTAILNWQQEPFGTLQKVPGLTSYILHRLLPPEVKLIVRLVGQPVPFQFQISIPKLQVQFGRFCGQRNSRILEYVSVVGAQQKKLVFVFVRLNVCYSSPI